MRRLLASSFVFPVVLASIGCSSSSSLSSAAAVEPVPASAAERSADAVLEVWQAKSAGHHFYARFATPPGDVVCVDEVVEGCVVSTCTPGTGSASFGPAFDPGTIAVREAGGAATPIPLIDGGGTLDEPGELPDGAELRFVVSGGADFPAFEETAHVPPELYGFSLDGCDSTASGCALKRSDMTFAWSAIDGARLDVRLEPFGRYPSYVAATCSYDAGAGRGRLPGAIAARLAGQQNLRAYATVLDAPPRLHAGAKHVVSVRAKRTSPVAGFSLTVQ